MLLSNLKVLNGLIFAFMYMVIGILNMKYFIYLNTNELFILSCLFRMIHFVLYKSVVLILLNIIVYLTFHFCPMSYKNIVYLLKFVFRLCIDLVWCDLDKHFYKNITISRPFTVLVQKPCKLTTISFHIKCLN